MKSIIWHVFFFFESLLIWFVIVVIISYEFVFLFFNCTCVECDSLFENLFINMVNKAKLKINFTVFSVKTLL